MSFNANLFTSEGIYRRRLAPAILSTTLMLAPALFIRAATTHTQGGQQASAGNKRRPLPKPPRGSRGFEQYAGKDAPSRLIGMGATRGSGVARKPVAPLEGIALDARPFFLWEPAPQGMYKFTLYEGDIYTTPSAKIVFETDTKQPQLIYPETAPALIKGNLYSWRISATPATIRDGSSGSVMTGAPVRLFVLMDEDAALVKQALADANVATPRTSDERLRQARILAEHGVWYDSLRIARELSAEDPKDEAVASFYNSLIEQLDQ